MAKRYIETGFYKSPYVRGLKGSLKALYSYIICDADSAGIWVKDLAIASAYIGFQVTDRDFEIFVKDNKAWDLKNGKFFFPDFIEHQYPNGLKPENPATKKTIKELLRYGLIDQDLKVVQSLSKGSIQDPHVVVTVTEDVEEVEAVIVKGAKNEKLILPYDDHEFKQAWETLLTQKKWKGKSKVALQASLKKLAGRDVSEAIQMIENTIAGEWQGIFELKPSDRGSPKKSDQVDKYRAASAKQDEEIIKMHGSK